jgi:4-alpha-glucanotransferase
MITDLLGTKQRFNEPGQGGDVNWSQRLEATLDELEKRPEYAENISAFKSLILKTNRLPRKTAAKSAK